MKSLTKILLLAATLALGGKSVKAQEQTSIGDGSAQEKSVEFTGNFDYVGRYMFRSLKFSEKDAIQSAVTATYGGLSATQFSNYDMDARVCNEMDVAISYSQPIEIPTKEPIRLGTLTLSGTYLQLPTTSLVKEREISASFTADLPLGPTMTYAHTVDYGGDFVGIIGSCETSVAGLPLKMSVGLDYVDKYWSSSPAGWSGLEGKVSTSIPIKPGFSVDPSISFSKSLMPKEYESIIYAGISMKF